MHLYSSQNIINLRFQIGDRILAVCGNDIRQASHEDAVKTIKEAGEKMLLLVQSLNNNRAKESSLLSVGFVKSKPAPVTPSVTPLPTLIQEGLNNEDDGDGEVSIYMSNALQVNKKFIEIEWISQEDAEPPEKTDTEKAVKHSGKINTCFFCPNLPLMV